MNCRDIVTGTGIGGKRDKECKILRAETLGKGLDGQDR